MLYSNKNLGYILFSVVQLRVQLTVMPWTVAYRQEYWSGLPFPPPGELPNPRNQTRSVPSPALAGRFFITVPPGKPRVIFNYLVLLLWQTKCFIKADSNIQLHVGYSLKILLLELQKDEE